MPKFEIGDYTITHETGHHKRSVRVEHSETKIYVESLWWRKRKNSRHWKFASLNWRNIPQPRGLQAASQLRDCLEMIIDIAERHQEFFEEPENFVFRFIATISEG